ncbi:MAG TPA: flagellar basal body-associated FliL family protein [Rhizomicrobium sp.]|nr:flagellar basal body-associated FliL family protein [Rhizomicrobium sp.]
MAKKESEAEDDAPEGENAEGSAPQAPKGLKRFLTRKMLMIAVPALLLVLGGGGAGAYFFLMKGDEGAHEVVEEVPLTPPEVAFSDIEKLTVNIQGADATPAYLQLSVSLELENEEQKAAMESLLPRVKDQFQAYLRELRLEDLKGSAGVLRIKEELLRRVNVAAAPYKVRDVLLKEMLVQ